MIDLNEMKKQSLEIAKLRGQEVDVLSCLKHCSGEIVEATDAYVDRKINNLKSETADVIMCMLTLAERVGFDVEKALKDCLEKNRARIPTDRKQLIIKDSEE